jgi:molybdenum cofactor biosynthesis enzyme MoaA
VLILYNRCAFECFFCASPGTSFRDHDDRTSWAQIEQHLLDAKPEEEGRLIIAGNEPLLHPDFEKTLALANTKGFTNIQLMTSGTLLDDSEALERWTAAGLGNVAIPIYSCHPQLHDEIVGAKAHERLVKALDLAYQKGISIHLHTLALRRNSHELLDLAVLAKERWGSRLSIAPLREKEGLFNWANETLSLVEIQQFLNSIPKNSPISLVGFPNCIGRDWPRAAADTITVYFMTQSRTFVDVCSSCTDKPTCSGIVDAFSRHGQVQGLIPLV